MGPTHSRFNPAHSHSKKKATQTNLSETPFFHSLNEQMAHLEIVLHVFPANPSFRAAPRQGGLQGNTPTLLAGTGRFNFKILAEQPETFLGWLAIHSRAGPDHVGK